jgi:hypothetical protein
MITVEIKLRFFLGAKTKNHEKPKFDMKKTDRLFSFFKRFALIECVKKPISISSTSSVLIKFHIAIIC